MGSQDGALVGAPGLGQPEGPGPDSFHKGLPGLLQDALEDDGRGKSNQAISRAPLPDPKGLSVHGHFLGPLLCSPTHLL